MERTEREQGGVSPSFTSRLPVTGPSAIGSPERWVEAFMGPTGFSGLYSSETSSVGLR